MRPGIWEIILIVFLIVILFASAKIPGMMKNLATGITTFKKEIKKDDTDQKKTVVAKKKTTVAKKKMVGVKRKNTKK